MSRVVNASCHFVYNKTIPSLKELYSKYTYYYSKQEPDESSPVAAEAESTELVETEE